MNLTNQPQNKTNRDYISFSEFKKWSTCPYARKLSYCDNIKLFHGNSYTAFGEAMHSTIEEMFSENSSLSKGEAASLFKENLISSLSSLEERMVDIEKDMPLQGEKILENFNDSFEKYFGDSYEVFSIEEEIHEEFSNYDTKYKGFIDMVLKDSSGNYNIIDWKTCSWGWNAKKRSDPLYVYQLSFYKHFFCKKHDIKPENVKTHFGLLKRTAAKNNVELFEVTNGKIRMKNAINALEKALANIASGPPIKNRLSCARCEYHKTEHCT